MSDKLQELKDGKYTQKFVAGLLYPDLDIKSAMAKLNSKLWNKHKRSLTEAEIKKIEIILS
jgi:hypothetical protein